MSFVLCGIVTFDSLTPTVQTSTFYRPSSLDNIYIFVLATVSTGLELDMEATEAFWQC